MFAGDFTRRFENSYLIEQVNLTRASYKEAVRFKEHVLQAITLKHYIIIIDMTACTFIDSTFLGTLVILHKRLKEKSGQLRIVTNSSYILDLMEQSRLNLYLNVFDSLENAFNKELVEYSG